MNYPLELLTDIIVLSHQDQLRLIRDVLNNHITTPATIPVDEAVDEVECDQLSLITEPHHIVAVHGIHYNNVKKIEFYVGDRRKSQNRVTIVENGFFIEDYGKLIRDHVLDYYLKDPTKSVSGVEVITDRSTGICIVLKNTNFDWVSAGLLIDYDNDPSFDRLSPFMDDVNKLYVGGIIDEINAEEFQNLIKDWPSLESFNFSWKDDINNPFKITKAQAELLAGTILNHCREGGNWANFTGLNVDQAIIDEFIVRGWKNVRQ